MYVYTCSCTLIHVYTHIWILVVQQQMSYSIILHFIFQIKSLIESGSPLLG